MKQCPKCKAELDDSARFCLYCMTSLDEKTQIPQPVRKRRLWSFVLLFCLLLGLAVFAIWDPPKETAAPSGPSITEALSTQPQSDANPDPSAISQTVDGVTYTFRPATREDHPTAITLDNYFVLIKAEGTPPDGVYRVPSFVGNDMTALVTVVADGAFSGTGAQTIDLGHNVRYVWGNAFDGSSLTDLYLHEDVLIDRTAFSGCTKDFTIHCPEYLENTEGILWSDLSVKYGFRWQPEAF